MTIIDDAPRVTLPPRGDDRNLEWEVGDAVTVGRTRWVIRALNSVTRRVYLVSASTTNHAIGWNTTVDKLPKKAA